MTDSKPNSAKGRPTPARKAQEAARKKPLVAPKTKEARQASRLQAKEENLKARAGYAAGDQKYLTKRDAGPQKALLRDIVDARWISAGEALIPIMFISLLTGTSGVMAVVLNIAVLAIFGIYLVDTFILVRKARKVLASKFGAGHVEKGIWPYVAIRAIYPRFIRLPKARVPRGFKL